MRSKYIESEYQTTEWNKKLINDEDKGLAASISPVNSKPTDL